MFLPITVPMYQPTVEVRQEVIIQAPAPKDEITPWVLKMYVDRAAQFDLKTKKK